jgi:hypothetical protein
MPTLVSMLCLADRPQHDAICMYVIDGGVAEISSGIKACCPGAIVIAQALNAS